MIFANFMFVGCSGKRPTNLGGLQTDLIPCPSKPNCVSSLAQNEQHKVEPIGYEGPQDRAMNRIKKIIETDNSGKIIYAGPTYVYAEYTSRIFGFVDDVEFLAIIDNPGVQVRSASRLGYSDMGVNRKRIDALRTEFKKLQATDKSVKKPNENEDAK
tara:strand:- start:179 stop:649 length:471 start_codon:yes stop_codon:yes gene_type:complete